MIGMHQASLPSTPLTIIFMNIGGFILQIFHLSLSFTTS